MNSAKKVNVKKGSNENILDFGGNTKLTKREKKMAFRRQAVFSLLVKGITNQYEIAENLHISQTTCSRDLQFLNAKFSEEMKLHIHDLPLTYKICATGISEVLRHAWSLLHDKSTKVNRVAVLSLIGQLYKDRLEIATNAAVITQALSELDSMKQQILGFGVNNESSSNLSTPIIAQVR